jgi:hypothetical protein
MTLGWGFSSTVFKKIKAKKSGFAARIKAAAKKAAETKRIADIKKAEEEKRQKEIDLKRLQEAEKKLQIIPQRISDETIKALSIKHNIPIASIKLKLAEKTLKEPVEKEIEAIIIDPTLRERIIAFKKYHGAKATSELLKRIQITPVKSIAQQYAEKGVL